MPRQTALNPRQETFVNEYVRTGFLNQAYIAAYPAAGNWKNAGSVTTQAIRTLKNPKVRALVRQLRGEVSDAAMWSSARVILALAETALEARAAGKHGPAVRAYELIGRQLGMFGREDLQASAPNVTLNVIQSLDQATLRTLASRYDAIEAEIAGPSATSRMAEIAGLPAPTPDAELSIPHSTAIPALDTYDDSST